MAGHLGVARSRGLQQAEILDTDAEIQAEILFEIRDPKSQAIFFPIISVKYGRELQCVISCYNG